MNNNHNNEKFPAFSKKVDDEVDKIVNSYLTTTEQRRLKSPINKYLKLFTVFFYAFMILGIMGIFFWMLNFTESTKTLVIVLSSIFLIAAVIFGVIIFIYNRNFKKIINQLQKIENSEKFYTFYSEIFYPKILINKIDHISDTIAEKNFSHYKNYDYTYTNLFLHGTFEEYPFSIGTKTYVKRVVTSNGKNIKITYYYYEHLYLAAEIDNIDFSTKITAENLATKIFKSRKSKDNALESQEFENLFKLDYNDPIKLRKLLAPRIMANLIDLSKKNKIPEIVIENNKLFINKLVQTYSSYARDTPTKNYFGNFNQYKISKTDDIKEAIKKVIENDFFKINQTLAWVDAFKLHLKYDIKQFQNK